MFAPIAVAVASVYAATLVPWAGWSHPFGLGGLFGDTVLGSVLGMLPLGAGVSLKLLSVGFGALTLAAGFLAAGYDRHELRATGRFLLLGLVMAYAGLVAVLRGGGRAAGRGLAAGGSHVAALRTRGAARLSASRAAPAAPGFGSSGPGSSGAMPSSADTSGTAQAIGSPSRRVARWCPHPIRARACRRALRRRGLRPLPVRARSRCCARRRPGGRSPSRTRRPRRRGTGRRGDRAAATRRPAGAGAGAHEARRGCARTGAGTGGAVARPGCGGAPETNRSAPALPMRSAIARRPDKPVSGPVRTGDQRPVSTGAAGPAAGGRRPGCRGSKADRGAAPPACRQRCRRSRWLTGCARPRPSRRPMCSRQPDAPNSRRTPPCTRRMPLSAGGDPRHVARADAHSVAAPTGGGAAGAQAPAPSRQAKAEAQPRLPFDQEARDLELPPLSCCRTRPKSERFCAVR